jgi:hypothetical protein
MSPDSGIYSAVEVAFASPTPIDQFTTNDPGRNRQAARPARAELVGLGDKTRNRPGPGIPDLSHRSLMAPSTATIPVDRGQLAKSPHSFSEWLARIGAGDMIAGASQNLGYSLSDQTAGNILRRFGIAPAPNGDKKSGGRTSSGFIWRSWPASISLQWKC